LTPALWVFASLTADFSRVFAFPAEMQEKILGSHPVASRRLFLQFPLNTSGTILESGSLDNVVLDSKTQELSIMPLREKIIFARFARRTRKTGNDICCKYALSSKEFNSSLGIWLHLRLFCKNIISKLAF
jgi:hypothetical protein